MTRNINSKKRNVDIGKQNYYYLVCQKLGSVGHVQQKIKLPSPYLDLLYPEMLPKIVF